jgi:hypothetical protein
MRRILSTTCRSEILRGLLVDRSRLLITPITTYYGSVEFSDSRSGWSIEFRFCKLSSKFYEDDLEAGGKFFLTYFGFLGGCFGKF